MQIVAIIIGLLLLAKYLSLNAPFVPTYAVDLERIAKIVEEFNCRNLCDLGSGNGRIINFLNKKFPDRKFSGIDLALFLYLFCVIRFRQYKNIKMKFGNVFWYDWSQYDSVFMFWITKYFTKREKLLREHLKSGQIIISYCFEIDFLKNKLIKEDKPDGRLPIFVYKF